MRDPLRDEVQVAINGRRCQVAGSDALLTLSDYLRRRLRLVGSKIVCSEGDCGACTVLAGRFDQAAQAWDYRPIDSCIALMFQLDGVHIVTVEGLADEGQLNRVQQAMVDCHGSQCGFCTPGFVVQMTALCAQQRTLDVEDLRLGLTGNLCRCTGYIPIFDAGLAAADPAAAIQDRCPAPPDGFVRPASGRNGAPDDAIEIVAAVDADAHNENHDENHDDNHACRVYCPASLPAALEFLDAHPEAQIVAGATDLGVQFNKSHQRPAVLLDLNRVEALRYVRCEKGQVVAGARATWADLMDVFRDLAPPFYEILSRFGSPQIRHAATLGGNLANASPSADSLPFLYVMDAQVELAHRDRRRTVPIDQFYRGYKQLDLAAGEMITEVTIPTPADDDRLRLYKISRRRDLDIATFTAAVRLRVDAGQIVEAQVSFGAVGPTVIRARATEQFLVGRPFEVPTFIAAGDIAVAEVAPIADVRGSEDYRLQLTRNILQKFYHQESEPIRASC